MPKLLKPEAKLCPVCNSKEIFPYMGFQLGCQWECKKCGYRGPVVIERGNAKPLAKIK